MLLLWLFLVSVVSVQAGISSVNVVGSTNVQSVLSYQAPGSSSCTLEVSESPDYKPLVRDVDPATFPGADSDGRAGNLVDGSSRVFVIGRRAVEQGADGKWYSRALQANTLHYYRLHCAGPEHGQLPLAEHGRKRPDTDDHRPELRHPPQARLRAGR